MGTKQRFLNGKLTQTQETIYANLLIDQEQRYFLDFNATNIRELSQSLLNIAIEKTRKTLLKSEQKKAKEEQEIFSLDDFNKSYFLACKALETKLNSLTDEELRGLLIFQHPLDVVQSQLELYLRKNYLNIILGSLYFEGIGINALDLLYIATQEN